MKFAGVIFSSLSLVAWFLPSRSFAAASDFAGATKAEKSLATGNQKLGGTLTLPEQVPYLNPPDRPKQNLYFIGNGVAGVVASPDGRWSQMLGPGYGVRRTKIDETIELVIDGQAEAVKWEMKRARNTGVFYAQGENRGIGFMLIDHTRLVDRAKLGDTQLSRSLRLKNLSAEKHAVQVRIKLANATAILRDAAGRARGYRQGLIAIALTTDRATTSADGNVLETTTQVLQPGEFLDLGVIHDASGARDEDVVEKIRQIDDRSLATRAILDWQQWFNEVPAAYQLDRITDPRARDLVEGSLVVIKSNQSGDGGFMSSASVYNQGYIRDATMGLRGLHQTGHFREAKQWIEWVGVQFSAMKSIANWWSLAPVLGAVHGGGVGNWDFEQTSLFVLTVRDYYRATGDLATVRKVQPALQYCIDAQLKYAAAHRDKLLFQGDETEICLAIPAEKTGIGRRGEGSYSFTSAQSLAGALVFFIECETLTGGDPMAHRNAITKETVDLKQTLQRLLASIDRDFWRTDVAAVPLGYHETFRRLSDESWPSYPIVNFTLQPIYWSCPYGVNERRMADVAAMKRFFDPQTGLMQLFPGIDNGFSGHTLGFFLWDLLELKDPLSEKVYAALVRGSTVSWLGYWNEAYDARGVPYTDYAPLEDNGLRTMETGVNLSAIARYWHLGEQAP